MVTKKTLVVVESPAKAKTIGKYLGSDYIVVPSVGHIVDLVSGGRAGIGIDIENNFKPRYNIMPNKKEILNVIIDAASGAKEIFIASDPDREGEAIAWHIANALESTGLPIKRAEFAEITKKGVLHGIQNSRQLDQNLFEAQQTRRVLDRMVGYLVSPFIIDTLGPNLSAGRVQSVAMRLIVDKEREIEAFQPEEYWSINSVLAKGSVPTEKFQAKYAGKVTTKEIADKIKQELSTGDYTISTIDKEEKKRKPLPPLITTTLQTEASSRYKFPIVKTMKIAQTLYETGFITYMRTDSPRLPPESQVSCREYLTKHSLEMPTEANQYVSKNDAQGGHPAIQPTDVFKIPQNVFLSDDEQKIYRLIWERFVASQMNPAVYNTVSVTIKTSHGHTLKTNGKTLKSKGWLEVTGDADGNEDNETKLPILDVGDKLTLVAPKVVAKQKFTQPPSRYSEPLLVKELEHRGIGRPSTYAAIMSKITDRSYVVCKTNVFSPTDLGKSVVDNLVKHFDFVEYKYTADMELQLDKIAEGKSSYLSTMQSFYTPFALQLRKAYSANKKDYGFVCEKCNEKMDLKHGKFGYYMSCSSLSKCKNTFSCELIDDKPVKKIVTQNIVVDTACPKCGSGMFKKDGKFGPFYSCSTYPKCNGSGKIPYGKKCDKCNQEMYATVFGGQLKLACTGYPDCRNIENIPEETKQGNWIDPKELKTPKMNKNVKKILNSSRANKT